MSMMEPQVEWEKARQAAAKLESLLSDEVAYLIEGNKIKNVYSPVAWVRMCRIPSLQPAVSRMRFLSTQSRA